MQSKRVPIGQPSGLGAQAGHGRRSVSLFNLANESARLGQRLEERLTAVLEHGRFILGPEVEELEGALARFAGVRHVIGVSSGREALVIALMTLGVGPGDAVFLPAFTFAATASAITAVGATPVFVDVDPAICNMSPDRLQQALENTIATTQLRSKVVMPVDLYGLPADYAAINAIAGIHGLTTIADAAQSFGAMVGELPVGALAPVTATSFYPTKPLGAFGDGGAILTDDDALAAAARQIRNHGRDGSGEESARLGLTARLDTLQAAVLLAKLEIFENDLAARRRIAEHYGRAFENLVQTPPCPEGVAPAWASYTLRVDERDAVQQRLVQAGIETGVYYRVPLHRHPAFAPWAGSKKAYPVSDQLANSVLSLPIHPGLTNEDVDYVIEELLQVLS